MTLETAETVDLPSFERWLNSRGNGGSAFACAEAKFWLDQHQACAPGIKYCVAASVATPSVQPQNLHTIGLV
jgi:hypothetical protein